jgi:hypothetical protein
MQWRCRAAESTTSVEKYQERAGECRKHEVLIEGVKEESTRKTDRAGRIQ